MICFCPAESQEQEKAAVQGHCSKTKKARPRKQATEGRADKLQSKKKSAQNEMILIVFMDCLPKSLIVSVLFIYPD